MKKIMVLSLFLLFGLAIKGFCQTIYAPAKGEKYDAANSKLSSNAKDVTEAAAKKAKKDAYKICEPDERLKDKIAQCADKTADGTRCKRINSIGKGKFNQRIGA